MPANPLLPANGAATPAAQVLSVSELNRMARELLESALPLMWVGGEISNLVRAASGHVYFTLKDASAQVRCAMWRNRAQLLAFRPENGMRVEARALVTLYEARGDYQLSVEALRPAGIGSLFEAFNRLKAKLAAEGLFDEAGRRALPRYPRALGIVTSPQAAALRDVLVTLRRRAPHLPVVLYPAPVQGADAPARLLEAASDRVAADTRALAQKTTASGRQATIVSIGLMLLSAALGIVGAAVFSRTVTRPIGQALDLARDVARGDLTRSVSVTGKDETAALLGAMAPFALTHVGVDGGWAAAEAVQAGSGRGSAAGAGGAGAAGGAGYRGGGAGDAPSDGRAKAGGDKGSPPAGGAMGAAPGDAKGSPGGSAGGVGGRDPGRPEHHAAGWQERLRHGGAGRHPGLPEPDQQPRRRERPPGRAQDAGRRQQVQSGRGQRAPVGRAGSQQNRFLKNVRRS